MSRNPRASIDGLERIDQARIRKQWNKLDDRWLEAAGYIALKTLQRFWDRERLRKANFVRICEAVGVDWTLVVEQEIITVEQEHELVEALLPICPEPPDLKRLLQRECRIRLHDISKPQKKCQLTIKKVVDWIGWIDAPTKLLGLIIGAARHRPHHQLLQAFINANLDVVLSWSGWDFEPITVAQAQQLWGILMDLREPALIKSVFEKTVGRDRLFIHLSEQERHDLQCGERITVLNLYRLFDILLNRYPYGDDGQTPNLLIFVQQLCRQLEGQTGSELRHWLQALLVHCGDVSQIALTPQPEPQPVLSDCTYQEAVLMVCVEGEPGPSPPKKFRLMPYLQAYHPDGTAQPLAGVSRNPAQPYAYDAAALQDQAKAEIVPWIRESLTAIQPLKSPEGGQLELRIEVFLPYPLLNWAVDLTEIHAITKKSLGTAYKVVGRSYERYADLMLAYEFTAAWERWYQPQVQGKANLSDWQRYVETIHHPDEITAQKCAAVCANVNHKWVLKMTCPPPINDQHDFFLHVVNGTIPIMIWTRCTNLGTVDDWSTVLDPLVTWEQVRCCDKLMETVRQERAKAYGTGQPQDHLGHYLSVLYDNPDVRPEVMELSEA